MRATTRIESIASFFCRRKTDPDGASTLSRSDRYVAARTLVQAYYAILFFFAMGSLYAWPGYLDTTELTPRWPIFWLRYVDLETGISLILWFYLLGSAIGLTLAKYRWARVVVLLSLLEFLAFRFSFGSINHGDHLGVLLKIGRAHV